MYQRTMLVRRHVCRLPQNKFAAVLQVQVTFDSGEGPLAVMRQHSAHSTKTQILLPGAHAWTTVNQVLPGLHDCICMLIEWLHQSSFQQLTHLSQPRACLVGTAHAHTAVTWLSAGCNQ